MSKKKSTHKVGRDAKMGKFITVKEAKRRPSTTVVETIKVKGSTRIKVKGDFEDDDKTDRPGPRKKKK